MFPNDPFQFCAHIDLKWGEEIRCTMNSNLIFNTYETKGLFTLISKLMFIFFCISVFFCAKATIWIFPETNFIPQINCFRSFHIIEYPKDAKNEIKTHQNCFALNYEYIMAYGQCVCICFFFLEE